MSRKTKHPDSFAEAARYYRNARELLGRCKVKDDLYEDIKPVQEAFGTAWLAVDKAIKAALLERGLSEEQVPRSWEALRAMAAKHLAVHNGKLIGLLNTSYKVIHLGGYYYGDFVVPEAARASMAIARRVIETLSHRKVV